MQNNLNYITSKSEIGYILNNVLKGDRLNLHDCKELIKSDDLYTIGLVASTLRKILFGNTATFINNIILKKFKFFEKDACGKLYGWRFAVKSRTGRLLGDPEIWR